MRPNLNPSGIAAQVQGALRDAGTPSGSPSEGSIQVYSGTVGGYAAVALVERPSAQEIVVANNARNVRSKDNSKQEKKLFWEPNSHARDKLNIVKCRIQRISGSVLKLNR